jgi:hypothetical protein
MNKNEQETSATKEVHVSFIKKKSSNRSKLMTGLSEDKKFIQEVKKQTII